ncbi:hypothetical protein [Desulforamulus profundi]|uniref:hypothetical protein n=1 Tax=Desulforamulus profundi TaxID=1383067 RepID=UPI0030834A87
MGLIATHLLRLVQNEDRAVGFDDINGPAAAEIIQYIIDTAGFFTSGIFFQGSIEGLYVDNHHVNTGTGAEIIKLG